MVKVRHYGCNDVAAEVEVNMLSQKFSHASQCHSSHLLHNSSNRIVDYFQSEKYFQKNTFRVKNPFSKFLDIICMQVIFQTKAT